MNRISAYICGDSGGSDEFNPFKITQQDHVPEMLFLLNSAPMNVNELSSNLDIGVELVEKLLNDLSKIRAVVHQDGRWAVSFAIFSKQDIDLIAERTEKPARRLAEEIMGTGPEIEKRLLQLTCAKQVEMKKLMLAVVGCFLLDWRSLEILNEKNLTLCGKKEQPGGGKYILLGKEEGVEKKLYDKVYWGSHNSNFGGFKFTSFGDHTGYRYSFPDLVWNFPDTTSQNRTDLPDWLRTNISEAVRTFETNSLVDCGQLLLFLNKKGSFDIGHLASKLGKEKYQIEILLRLLSDMKYVTLTDEKVGLNYPVFETQDKGIVDSAWEIVSESIEREACRYFDSLRSELAEITPIRRGIDPREIYTDIWHWVFGQTNRIMAERGFLFDPTREREQEGRYIAWIEEAY